MGLHLLNIRAELLKVGFHCLVNKERSFEMRMIEPDGNSDSEDGSDGAALGDKYQPKKLTM